MLSKKYTQWLGIAATFAGIFGLVFYVMELNSKIRELENKVQTLELERDELVQIRDKYFDLIIKYADTGKISPQDISSLLTKKEARRLNKRLWSKTSFSLPANVNEPFHASGWMGDGEYDTKYISFTRTDSYIKIHYSFGPKGWAGICWQYPNNNRGDQPGYNLVNASRLRFLAKGEKGNEIVEFKAGGIKGKKFEDSFEKLSFSTLRWRVTINITLLTEFKARVYRQKIFTPPYGPILASIKVASFAI